jgi:hypothetical protein
MDNEQNLPPFGHMCTKRIGSSLALVMLTRSKATLANLQLLTYSLKLKSWSINQ